MRCMVGSGEGSERGTDGRLAEEDCASLQAAVVVSDLKTLLNWIYSQPPGALEDLYCTSSKGVGYIAQVSLLISLGCSVRKRRSELTTDP